MSRNKKIELNVEDKLLHQDRWIVFMIILGMAAIFFTILEVHKINSEFEKAEGIEESYHA
jgi:hypothetical protein